MTSIVLRHDQPFRLPAVCACCLSPTGDTQKEWVQLGNGYRRELSLPECPRCRALKSWGLGLGALTLVGSGALGLALGALLFPLGAMRIVPMLVVMPLAMGAFVVLRRLLHPKGHVPHCAPIARADVELGGALTQDVRIHFANPEFVRLFCELNPESAR